MKSAPSPMLNLSPNHLVHQISQLESQYGGIDWDARRQHIYEQYDGVDLSTVRIEDDLPEQAADYHNLTVAQKEDPNLLPENTIRAKNLSILGSVIAASLGMVECGDVEPLGQDLLVFGNGRKDFYVYFTRNCRDGTFIKGLRDKYTIDEFHSIVMKALGRKHCLAIEMEFDANPVGLNKSMESASMDCASTIDTNELDGGGTKVTLAIAVVDKSHLPSIVSQLVEDVFSKVSGLKVLNFPGLRADSGNSRDALYIENDDIPMLSNNKSLQKIEFENVSFDQDKERALATLPFGLKFKTCHIETGGAQLLLGGDKSRKKDIHIEGMNLSVDLRLLAEAVAENRIAKLRLEHEGSGFVVSGESDLGHVLTICRWAREHGIGVEWVYQDEEEDPKPFKLMFNYENRGIEGTRKLVEATLAKVSKAPSLPIQLS